MALLRETFGPLAEDRISIAEKQDIVYNIVAESLVLVAVSRLEPK
jgi:hypothetical protein